MTFGEKLRAAAKSRRVMGAVIGVVVAFSEQLGYDIPAETIQQTLLIVAALIVGDSIRKIDDK